MVRVEENQSLIAIGTLFCVVDSSYGVGSIVNHKIRTLSFFRRCRDENLFIWMTTNQVVLSLKMFPIALLRHQTLQTVFPIALQLCMLCHSALKAFLLPILCYLSFAFVRAIALLMVPLSLRFRDAQAGCEDPKPRENLIT